MSGRWVPTRLRVALGLLVLVGCGTTAGSGREWKHVPVGGEAPIDQICTDYGAGITCSGHPYRMNSGTRTANRHEGIDIRRPVGTPIYAAANGRVRTLLRRSGGCGGWIAIASEIFDIDPRTGTKRRLYTIYNHVEGVVGLRQGQEVKAGELIATIQDPSHPDARYSCWGDHPHLHFAMMFDQDEDQHVNPHFYWLNGPGQTTCFRPGMEVPPDKLVWPLAC